MSTHVCRRSPTQALALAARDRAIASLNGLGLHTSLLEGLAHFVVDRSH